MTFPTNDPLGLAVSDYFNLKIDHPLIIHSEGFDHDTMFPSYFFRKYKDMPLLERKALDLCKGKILDVGACAGAHAYWLQQKELNVTAIETSALCCEVMKQRGIKNVIEKDIFNLKKEKFDTILLLMNGTGIAGSLSSLNKLFLHLKKLLHEGGQILIDSSDLIYLFEEDGMATIDINTSKYYGELQYQFEYKGIKGAPFSWLYVDQETIKQSIQTCNLKIKQLYQGEHYDYLLQIEK